LIFLAQDHETKDKSTMLTYFVFDMPDIRYLS